MGIPTPPSPALVALFGLVPPRDANPIGTSLRTYWKRIVEAVLPGEPGNVTPGGPYRGTFFPFRALADASQGVILGQLGRDWWVNYSVALVSQALYNLATTQRPYINEASIASDLASWNLGLRDSALSGYQTVFDAAQAGDVTAAAGSDAVAARQAYHDLWTSTAWIAEKAAAFRSGQWPDADWELFHHAIKLLALGGSSDDVTHALQALAQGGLPMPAALTADNWGSYRGFVGDPPIDWSDLRADGSGFNTPSEIDDEGYTATTDGIANWFICGTKYFVQGSSCFTATTRVLGADGLDAVIADVRPGDQVWTPGGPRRVRVAARVPRGGRTLHRVDDYAFAASDSHPFVDGAQPQGSLAVHPARAAALAGGLASNGVNRLAPGAVLALVRRDGRRSTGAVGAVHGEAGGDDDDLVDLVLEPDADGFPAFAVGDGGETPFVVVRSESVRFEQHPLGALGGLALLQGLRTESAAFVASLSPADAPLLSRAVAHLANQVLAEAMRDAAPVAAAAATASSRPLHARVADHLDAFHEAAGAYDWRTGLLLEAIATSLLVPGEHLIAGGWRPFGVVGAPASHLSVTLHAVIGEGHRPLTGDWTIHLSLDGVPVGSTTVAAGRASHYRPIDWTVTVPIAAHDTTGAGPLMGLRVEGPDGVVLTGEARLRVRGLGFVASVVAVRATVAGPVDATVFVDARRLDAAAAADHPCCTPADWDAGRRQALAEALGSAMARRLVALLPAALARLRPAVGQWAFNAVST